MAAAPARRRPTNEDRKEVERTDLRVFTRRFLKANTFVAARPMERAVTRIEGDA